MHVDEISRIGVVGAGLMGHGIAQEFALAGYQVTMNDVSDEKLSEALQRIGANLRTLEDMGLVSADEAAPAPERIRTTTSFEDTVGDADYVVEAVFEDLSLKKRVFDQLGRSSPERTILASNSSTFMPSQLASATGGSERVLVAHYFNPPYLLPLVEVVRGPETSDETVEAVCALLARVGKRPVVLQKEALGFVANRLQMALLREAISIVERGIASAEDVDLVVKNSIGRRLAVAGPFEVFEAAGWDVIAAILEELLPKIESSTELPALVGEMVGRGDFGLKTGKGFYQWSPESATALRQRIGKALVAIERLPT